MNRDPKFYRRLALYSSIVVILPTTVVGGFLLGRYLDSEWGTKPWLAILGFCVGVAGACIEVFRILKTEKSQTNRQGRDRKSQ